MALRISLRRRPAPGPRPEADLVAAIVESSADAIIGAGLDGLIASWNPAAERLFGYTAEEAIGLPVSRIVAPAHHHVFEGDFRAIRRGERIAPHRVLHRRKDGSDFEVSLTAAPIKDASGAIVGAAAIMRDVSELTRLAAELEQSRAFLESVIDNIPAMVIVKDAPSGRFVICNRTGAERIGRPREEILGKTDHELFPPEQAEFFARKDREALALGEVEIPEEPLSSRKQGLRWLHTRKIAVKGRDGTATHIVLVAEDVTESKRVQKMKDEVISMASHELKSPLTALAGIVGTLVDAKELAPRDREMLALAYRTVQRMARMVGDYLDIERIESDRAEFAASRPLDLGPLAQEAIASMQAYAARNRIEFSVRAEGGPWTVLGDPDRLMQVIMNLLSNAGKFTEPGTAVEVSLARADGSVRVSVTDHGPGVPPELHDRIFERFAQSKVPGAREKGSGLGLSISKAIVEKLGGRMAFSSRPGATTFSFELPAAPAPP
ncbi:MAG: PAS domain S-box protein [Elusimicrobia bacterium]|nr:PAS domain S-box protein [Elusimicrobiota bacterium]